MTSIMCDLVTETNIAQALQFCENTSEHDSLKTGGVILPAHIRVFLFILIIYLLSVAAMHTDSISITLVFTAAALSL